MNKIEENIFESMSYKINSLKDELSIARDDYEDLRTEVIHIIIIIVIQCLILNI